MASADRHYVIDHCPRDIVELLAVLRELLEPLDERLRVADGDPRPPLGLVIGCPRSGSTLLMQILAHSSGFAYPSNLLNRFAYAPLIGGLVERMLFDPRYDPDGSFSDLLCSAPSFRSTLGKTHQARDAAEFQHFWRRFLAFDYPRYLAPEEIDAVDLRRLGRELHGIRTLYDKPFVCKGHAIQYNIEAFDDVLEAPIYLRNRRHPFLVMQSILLARETYHGDRETWWSLRPRGAIDRAYGDVYKQVAAQVYWTERELDEGLSKVSKDRIVEVGYGAMCGNPRRLLDDVVRCYAAAGVEVELAGQAIPDQFNQSRSIRLSAKERRAVGRAWLEVSGEELVLDEEFAVDGLRDGNRGSHASS